MSIVKIKKIIKKKGKYPIVCLTSYSRFTAEILDKYCDIILVGDSLGMVLYGFKNTKEVTLQTMIQHAKTVKKFAKKSLVVFDMPYKTYSNKITAYKNAKKVLKITKCDAVKLEGGKEIINIVKHLVKKGIPVMGHIGLLPQSASKFKLQGKNILQRKKIFNDALVLSKSGVFSIVIECVVESLAKKITEGIDVPTIGIGASQYCDGQILVTDDLIGLNPIKVRFVKQYSNIKKIIKNAVLNYSKDVSEKKFPKKQHSY